MLLKDYGKRWQLHSKRNLLAGAVDLFLSGNVKSVYIGGKITLSLQNVYRISLILRQMRTGTPAALT